VSGSGGALAGPTVRVYVNGRGVDVPAGATALDALRVAAPDAADAVLSGMRAVTDSRGLPADLGAPVYGGAIFRLVGARPRGSDDPASP